MLLCGDERPPCELLCGDEHLMVFCYFELILLQVPSNFVLTLPHLHELFHVKVIAAKNPEMLPVILEMLRSVLHEKEASFRDFVSPSCHFSFIICVFVCQVVAWLIDRCWDGRPQKTRSAGGWRPCRRSRRHLDGWLPTVGGIADAAGMSRRATAVSLYRRCLAAQPSPHLPQRGLPPTLHTRYVSTEFTLLFTVYPPTPYPVLVC